MRKSVLCPQISRFPDFLARLEELSGRFLAPRVGGRPRKAATQGKARKHG